MIEQQEHLMELAVTDPVILLLMMRYQRGEWTWEQMLYEGVLLLSEQNKNLIKAIEKEIANRPPGYHWEKRVISEGVK